MAKHRRKGMSFWRGEYFFYRNQWRFFIKPDIKRKLAGIMGYFSFLRDKK